MNKVILIGRLTRDPELRSTTSGLASTNFTVAVNRAYTSQSGERDADFISCVAWRNQAENIAKYCQKGSQVAVEGRIQTRNYDAQDGTKRYVTEVVADNVTFLSPKGATTGSATSFSNNNYEGPQSNVQTTNLAEDTYKDFGSEVELSDEDLPF